MSWRVPRKPAVPSSRIPKAAPPSTPDGVAHTIRGLQCGAFVAVTKRHEWLYIPQELRQLMPHQVWGNNSFRARGWFCLPEEAHIPIATIGGSLGYPEGAVRASRLYLIEDSNQEIPATSRSIPSQMLAEWKILLGLSSMQI
jgi:hypothetical protein